MSGIVDWTDRATCVIFGDGAGAVVLGEGEGHLASCLNTAGGDTVLRVPRHPGASPFYTRSSPPPYIFMSGQDTFKFAVGSMARDIQTVVSDAGYTKEDVAFVVPHQANRRIIESAAARLLMPIEKFIVNIERYGNTSAASVPITLHELAQSGKLQSGDLVVMCAFGGGLASAACLVRWCG